MRRTRDLPRDDLDGGTRIGLYARLAVIAVALCLSGYVGMRSGSPIGWMMAAMAGVYLLVLVFALVRERAQQREARQRKETLRASRERRSARRREIGAGA